MAVAKCGACKATVTVRIIEGACATTFGESFRTRCKKRREGTTLEPADCEAMQAAVARAQKRAALEHARATAAPPPVAVSAPS
jgi:hypothetical protein